MANPKFVTMEEHSALGGKLTEAEATIARVEAAMTEMRQYASDIRDSLPAVAQVLDAHADLLEAALTPVKEA